MTTDVWEQAFLAALNGAACRPWEEGKKEEYLINRAIVVADLATKQVEQRRDYIARNTVSLAPKPAPRKL